MCQKGTVIVLIFVTGCAPGGSSTGKTTEPAKEKSPFQDKSPPPPCHPGCFPAGTLIATPDGARRIEAIAPGEVVVLISPDGTSVVGPVHSTFQTCNRLVEVRTESGDLVTTETQPLGLRDGEFRRAGELVAGDVIWRWENGQRHAARVRAVVATGQEAPVFNLVVGESGVFVAGGFLARGKPPALASASGTGD